MSARKSCVCHDTWDDPLIREDETFDLGGRITGEDIQRAVEQSIEATEGTPEPR